MFDLVLRAYRAGNGWTRGTGCFVFCWGPGLKGAGRGPTPRKFNSAPPRTPNERDTHPPKSNGTMPDAPQIVVAASISFIIISEEAELVVEHHLVHFAAEDV